MNGSEGTRASTEGRRERRWTPAQEQAITLRGRHLLVSAAAGAGKTSVLVERITRRLLDPDAPVDIDRLLVVTFTEAAAAEMRERIRQRLEEAVAARPGDPRLRRQLALLGRASISTLHAFCLRIIRQYFFRLGLDPGVKVAGEHEAELLQQEVLEEVFERRYSAGDAAFLDLVECYGGRAGEDLRHLVLQLYTMAYSQPWPGAWLDGLVARYRQALESGVEASRWFVTSRAALRRRLERMAGELERAARQCRQPGGPLAWEETFLQDAGRLRELAGRLDDLDWEGIRQALRAAASWPALPRTPSGDAAARRLKERIKKPRDEAKKALQELAEGLWGRPVEDVRADLRQLLPRVEALVALVREFASALAAAKQERGLIDFADMEHYALRLLLDPAGEPGDLRPSPVALEFRRWFEEVLVDEYQDINPLQDAILRLVARDGEDGPPNLFMVGDVKQSIYRFRQAEPGLFLAKYHAFAAVAPGTPAPAGPDGSAGETPPAADGWRVELNANFRSRPSVVAAVNDLFRRIMTPELGGLAYDRAAALVAGAEYPPPPAGAGSAGEAPVEVYLLERAPAAPMPSGGERGGAAAGSAPGLPGQVEAASPGGDRLEERAGGGSAGPGTAATQPGEAEGEGESEEAADLTALEREAEVVARRIRQLVEGEPGRPPLAVWDPQEQRYRPARYRDVVVLLRAAQQRAAVFVEILGRRGVPVYARARSGYLTAIEVEMVLALLRVIDNPRQDVPLAAVLRSPIVGLSAADLARIRLAAPGADFYTAACQLAGWDPDREEPVSPEGQASSARAARPEPGAPGGEVPGAPEGTVPGSAPSPAHPGDRLAKELRRFLADLRRWRTAARRAPLSHLIQQIYDETGILTYVAGMPGGEQRRANLEALRERARQFDQFARQGLFRFLRFIDRLRERGDDLGMAPAVGENEDVVRVMTIHQSKGLEFPVVVVADLGAQFRFDQGQALIDRDLGLGLKVADPALRIRYPSLAYEAVRVQGRLATLAEELRVLYVALTRARERLILVGSVRDLPGAAAAWLAEAGDGQGPLPAAVLEGARSFLDWLGPALITHPDGEPLRRLAQGLPPVAAAAGESSARAGAGAGGGDDGEPAPGPQGDAGGGSRPGGDRPGEEEDAAPRSRWAWYLDGAGGTGAPAAEAAGEGEPLWSHLLRGEPLAEGEVDPAAVAVLRSRLRWRYPYAALADRFAKRSVSELKDRPDPEREAYPLPAELRQGLRRPRFRGTAPAPAGAGRSSPGTEPLVSLSGAERGTATHRVLQHLDLEGELDGPSIRRQVEALVARELLTPAEAAAVDVEALARFFAGPLGRRLRRGRHRLHREWMFTLGLPASEVYPDLAEAVPAEVASREIVVVQGVIDCFVEEDDGLLLLDFKTDDPRGRPLAELAARYQGQVRLYRRALEEILGRPVREAYLYFLAAGEAVPVG